VNDSRVYNLEAVKNGILKENFSILWKCWNGNICPGVSKYFCNYNDF